MTFDEDKTKLPNLTATILGWFLFIVVTSYFGLKMSVMIENANSAVTIATHDNWFNSTETFGSDVGLEIAVSVTDFDSGRGELLDKSYGSLVFTSSDWDTKDGVIYWS